MKQKRENICMLLAICFVGVLLGELYLFKTYPNSVYMLIAGLAVLLILTYFLSSNLMALHNQWMEEKSAKQEELLNRLITELSNNKEDRTQEALANVEKFEKAIYLAVQQHTAKMQESFEHLDQCFAGDFDRLNNMLEDTQKSIVEQIQTTGDHSDKVYVKFSRENTKSLMMLQKKAFDNVMLGMEETVHEYTKANENTLAKLEELKQALAHLNLQTAPIEEVPTTNVEEDILPEFSTETAVTDDTLVMDDTLSEYAVEDTVLEEPVTEDISVSDEVPSDEEAAVVEDTSSEEATVIEDVPSVEEPSTVSDDPNHVMTPEEIAALVSGSSETTLDEDTSSEEATVIEEVPSVEEPSTVSDDPNHVMTPEEIAALVSGTPQPSVEEATVTEEIPFVDEAPVIPEAPAINSDPNHVMTPEEIAALIAGTQ